MTTDKPTWDDEAANKIEQAPFFIRKIAKNRVEKAAIDQGLTRITVEFVELIRKKGSTD